MPTPLVMVVTCLLSACGGDGACVPDDALANCAVPSSMCGEARICTMSGVCRPTDGLREDRCDPSRGFDVYFCMPDEMLADGSTDFEGTVTSVSATELILTDAFATTHRLEYYMGPYTLPVAVGEDVILTYRWTGPWTCAAGITIVRGGDLVFAGTSTWGVWAPNEILGLTVERVGICCALDATGVVGGGWAGVPMGLLTSPGAVLVGAGEEGTVTLAGAAFTIVGARVFDMTGICEDVGTEPAYLLFRQ